MNAPALTRIDDPETLLRSVRTSGNFYRYDESGGLQISTTAFNDPARQPSLDRLIFLQSADAAKKSHTDGLLRLIAHEIRAIQLSQIGANGQPLQGQFHRIEPIHSPILAGNAAGHPPNPAHSHIESAPVLSGARFNRLKELLAKMAQKHGWVVTPS